MFPVFSNSNTAKTTTHKVVVPFYVYAASSFLAATVLLLNSTPAFLGHYFHPKILAVTHMMALGWGTMIILGASHQLVPVLIEGELYSNKLAYVSFLLAAIGIPLLVYGFYVFEMGPIARWGGRFIVLSFLAYLINVGVSISKSKNENIHAIYIFTSVVWLFITAFLGLALVYNFTATVMPYNSVHYLPLHVHTGMVGWFLLLVFGVASRLIPMFLISKYTNVKLLRWIYFLINAALVSYILIFYFIKEIELIIFSGLMLLSAICLFIYYCYNAFKQRVRKQVDQQMKMSLLSVLMILVPVVLLLVTIALLSFLAVEENVLFLCYGFLVLFGWITAIILGMTFKTLPFIIWNRVYHHRSGSGKTPNPKDLFSSSVFRIMGMVYLSGLVLFVTGILNGYLILLKSGAVMLLFTAVLYVFNVIKLVTHKPNKL